MDETKRLREAVKEVHDLLNSHDGVECNANIIGMLSKNRELEKQAQLWQDQALDYYGKLTLWQRRTLSYIHGIRQYESLVTHLIHATAAAGLADVVTPEAQKHRLEFLRLVKKDIAELPSTTVPATHVADDEPAIDPDNKATEKPKDKRIIAIYYRRRKEMMFQCLKDHHLENVAIRLDPANCNTKIVQNCKSMGDRIMAWYELWHYDNLLMTINETEVHSVEYADKCKDETNGKGEDWPLPPYTAPPSKPPAQVHTATDGTKQEEPDDYGHH